MIDALQSTLIPLWALCALLAAWAVTSIPLIQEKYQADGFALTFWVKVFIGLAMTIPVLSIRLDFSLRFYIYVTLSTLVYIVSDITYFKSVPKVGSGIVTRLLPSSVVITFIVWFLIEPERLKPYMENPYIGSATAALIGLFVFFALQLRKCPLSWQGVRMIWPVILAACIGPVLTKIALSEIEGNNAVYVYLFVQSTMTVGFLGLYYLVKKPIPLSIFASYNSIRTGMIIGAIMCITLLLKLKALQLADNPGYVTMIFFTDAVWVLWVYKWLGRKDDSRIWPGLGIVGCAAALIFLKQYAA